MIILGKGTVITRDADRPIIYDGAVAIDGTQIVDIGTYDELCKTYANAEIIDAHGGLIMPGFINAHHHIYSCSLHEAYRYQVQHRLTSVKSWKDFGST